MAPTLYAGKRGQAPLPDQEMFSVEFTFWIEKLSS